MNQWLSQVKDALAAALDKAEAEHTGMTNLYQLAPALFSATFKIRNQALIDQMIDENNNQVALDWSYDEESKHQFRFHFVSSYLRCFLIAGKLDELQYDKVMAYVCPRMKLFTDSYGS